MQTFLSTADDMRWLADVHTPLAATHACAILHGNADAPTKIELFKVNHIRCQPTILEPDQDGLLIVTSHSDKPHVCIVCGHDLGWSRPSGVCSTRCLNLAQGFPT